MLDFSALSCYYCFNTRGSQQDCFGICPSCVPFYVCLTYSVRLLFFLLLRPSPYTLTRFPKSFLFGFPLPSVLIIPLSSFHLAPFSISFPAIPLLQYILYTCTSILSIVFRQIIKIIIYCTVSMSTLFLRLFYTPLFSLIAAITNSLRLLYPCSFAALSISCISPFGTTTENLS